MSGDFLRLAVAGVQKLAPYQPGTPVSELARELGLHEPSIVKLASNENPLGPSAKVAQAISAAAAELSRYPDGSGFALKQVLAARYQVSPLQITLGNGSNDLLELVARAFLAPGLNAAFSEYAFAVYPLSTQAVGAEGRMVAARDYGHDLPAMLAAIDTQTRVLFIANPNNPTGTWFNRAALRDFLNQVPPSVLVVLDEAYIEYADHELPNGLELLADYPNLLVLRTFSKAFGLAGLRIGYGISSVDIAEVLNRVRAPFNVNTLAQVAAIAALDDSAHLQRSIETNAQGMRQLKAGLNQLGLTTLPSKANFITIDFAREAAPIDRALLQRGVIVRSLAPYGMPHFLRVSIGTPAENARFLEALGEVLLHA